MIEIWPIFRSAARETVVLLVSHSGSMEVSSSWASRQYWREALMEFGEGLTAGEVRYGEEQWRD